MAGYFRTIEVSYPSSNINIARQQVLIDQANFNGISDLDVLGILIRKRLVGDADDDGADLFFACPILASMNAFLRSIRTRWRSLIASVLSFVWLMRFSLSG